MKEKIRSMSSPEKESKFLLNTLQVQIDFEISRDDLLSLIGPVKKFKAYCLKEGELPTACTNKIKLESLGDLIEIQFSKKIHQNGPDDFKPKPSQLLLCTKEQEFWSDSFDLS